MTRPKVKKVVLAYSGGLDTSVILAWLREEYKCQVVAFAADLGQGSEMDGVKEKALRTGASEVHIVDVREEFVRDFIFPALKCNAVYEGYYLLGTSIARPIIAKTQVEVARKVGADALSHGATGKGNDQVRFELAYHALMPSAAIIAPWREWDLRSRSDLVQYARERNIPVPVTADKPYSSDRNLLHISYEGGILEDPWSEPKEDMFTLTVAPEDAPDKAEYVTIDFEDGVPAAVDGEPLSPANLLSRLNEMGGRHGVGRIDMVENRYIGMKSRGVYETPGGTILHMAHRAMESVTMDREVMHLRDSLTPRFSALIYNGYWFTPEMEWLRKCIDETQVGVTGTVRLKLYKGLCRVVGRKAPHSLYMHDFATFEKESVFDQADSTGFIRVNALRIRINALARRREGK